MTFAKIMVYSLCLLLYGLSSIVVVVTARSSNAVVNGQFNLFDNQKERIKILVPSLFRHDCTDNVKKLSLLLTTRKYKTILHSKQQQQQTTTLENGFDTNKPALLSSSLLTSTLSISRGGSSGDPYGRDDDNYYKDDVHDAYGDKRDEYYNDRGFSSRDRYYDEEDIPGSRKGPSLSNMPDIIRTGNRQIGLPLLGIGAALTVLGMSLFFNKTLMRLGNLFFVAGVPMTIGPGRTAGYFFQPTKARATACLALGLILVFVGWPILGIILEAFGFLNLFGNMFPFALAVVKQMPVIGPLLKGTSATTGGTGSSSNKNQRRDYYDDSFYDDNYQESDRYYDKPSYGRDYYNGRGDEDDDSRSKYY